RRCKARRPPRRSASPVRSSRYRRAPSRPSSRAAAATRGAPCLPVPPLPASSSTAPCARGLPHRRPPCFRNGEPDVRIDEGQLRTLGELVADALEARGIGSRSSSLVTPAELARLLGVTRDYIY